MGPCSGFERVWFLNVFGTVRIEHLERDGKGPIKTDVYGPDESSVTPWYDAEEYHQDFYAKQSARSWI